MCQSCHIRFEVSSPHEPQLKGPGFVSRLYSTLKTLQLFQDLIETIVNLQQRIESQARKQSDLEDYIDSLLTKVLATAPCLLQKDGSLASDSFGVKLSHTIK